MKLSGTLYYNCLKNLDKENIDSIVSSYILYDENIFKSIKNLYPSVDKNSVLYSKLNKKIDELNLRYYLIPSDFNELLSSCLKLQENLFFYQEKTDDPLIYKNVFVNNKTKFSKLKYYINYLKEISNDLKIKSDNFKSIGYEIMNSNLDEVDKLKLINELNKKHFDYINKFKKEINSLKKFLVTCNTIFELTFKTKYEILIKFHNYFLELMNIIYQKHLLKINFLYNKLLILNRCIKGE